MALFFLLGGSAPASAVTFFGEVPTGLVELKDYHYPVYLFVPENYKPERSYSLLIAVPGEGESPAENIKFWLSQAKRQSLMVLSPTNLRPEEEPYAMDRWLLRLKKDITDRYHISPERIYLVGKGGGAHYASYLGTRYPREFSAVALLGGSWAGKFEKLIHPQSQPRRQVPFFVSLKEGNSLLEKTKQWIYRFEKKGYPVYFEQLESSEDFTSADFQKRLLKWLDEKGQHWQDRIRESQKSTKEKIRRGLEEYFNKVSS